MDAVLYFITGAATGSGILATALAYRVLSRAQAGPK